MIQLIFLYLFFSFSLVGYGYLIKELLFKKIVISQPELGLLGILIISFLVTLIHFFAPLHNYLNLILYIFGLIFLF